MAGLGPGNAPAMSFDIAVNDDATVVVTVRGELDIANVDSLEQAVERVLTGAIDRLVVDVGQLLFADSSAIAVWVRWSTLVEIELRDPSPLLRQVITSMGLDERLRLTP
jgi:anti-sigma B factor antagonist